MWVSMQGFKIFKFLVIFKLSQIFRVLHFYPKFPFIPNTPGHREIEEAAVALPWPRVGKPSCKPGLGPRLIMARLA